MSEIIRVAIVDDHQSIIDGYKYRLQGAEDIEVVGTAYYGEDVESLLDGRSVDILILDAHLPTSASNPSPFPTLLLLPQLLDKYTELHILIISMYNKTSFVEYAIEGGASGYIVKDDYKTINSLVDVLRSVVAGGVHFSLSAIRPILEDRSQSQILTPRQLQALSLCAAYPNETTAELANRLDVAHSTMRNLLSQSYFRLGVRSRTAAVVEARRRGLLLPP